MKKPWKSTSTTTLTDRISSFRGHNAMLSRCCCHTARTPPSEREKVLLIMNSIQSTDPLLNAHIATISRDPSGFGADFEKTATHLMLADPVTKTHAKQNTKGPSISTTSLAGGGLSTGVDL